MLDNLEEILGGALMIATFAVVLLEIFCRTALGFSLLWTEEGARILFLWTIFFGAGAATKHDGFISIDVVYRVLPPRLRRFSDVIRFVAVLSVVLLLGYAGLRITMRFANRPTPLARIPSKFLYGPAPAGCLLMAFRLIQKELKRFLEATNHNSKEMVE